MIRGIHHCCLSTENFDRLYAFYRDVIGCTPTFDEEIGGPFLETLIDTKGARMRCGMLKLGNAFIEIQQYFSPVGTRLGGDKRVMQYHLGISHVCFDVVDSNEVHERLTNLGVKFISPPQDYETVARTAFARDPDGNILEFQEILPPDHPLSLLRELGS